MQEIQFTLMQWKSTAGVLNNILAITCGYQHYLTDICVLTVGLALAYLLGIYWTDGCTNGYMFFCYLGSNTEKFNLTLYLNKREISKICNLLYNMYKYSKNKQYVGYVSIPWFQDL